jgi:hypothetical protein
MRFGSAVPVLTFHQDRTIDGWFEQFFEKAPVSQAGGALPA